MTKRPRAVVFGLTSNHVAAVATLLMDLAKLSPDIADVCIVIHDGKLLTRDQDLLTNIFPCVFRVYEFPIADLSVFKATTIERFSHMVFSKFECFRLLSEYSSVCWLDYDIVIQADITELMVPKLNSAKFILGGIPVTDQLHQDVLLKHPITEYNLDAEGMCGSTFVLFDTLPDAAAIYSFCYQALIEYAGHLHLGEQAIFDFAIQRFGIGFDSIEHTKYTPHPSDKINAPTAKIIHAYGTVKF